MSRAGPVCGVLLALVLVAWPRGVAGLVSPGLTQPPGSGVAVEAGEGGSGLRSGTPAGNPYPWDPIGPYKLYYHPDHLGSTSVVTDQAGSLASYIGYRPYGSTEVEYR